MAIGEHGGIRPQNFENIRKSRAKNWLFKPKLKVEQNKDFGFIADSRDLANPIPPLRDN